MTIAELKNTLHKLIVETNDITVLTQIKNYFIQLQDKTDWWDELTDEEKKAVEKGLKDLKNGNVHSDEDARAKIRQCISKAKKA